MTARYKKKIYKKRPPLTRKQRLVIKYTSNGLILLGVLFIFLSFGAVIRDELWYQLSLLKNQVYSLQKQEGSVDDSAFSRYLTSSLILLEPVNKDFSIVIERIGVNAPVVADVPVTNKEAYNEALKHGVAHAAVSDYPSEEPGNTYLFAHSATNFWQHNEYSGVFNLLRKTQVGDKVHVFREDKDYVYKVVNKEILPGWNTYPLTRRVIEPTLTIQTCDPPGTTFNRLIVTSKLVEVR